MLIEVLLLGVLLYVILEYNGSISTNKFIVDNSDIFKKLKEKDFDFYVKAKYGDAIDVEKIFNIRLRNGLMVIVLMLFLFITDLNYANILFSIIAGYGVFKLSYMSLKKHYKLHLHKIDLMLPYYLKNLEIFEKN